MRRITLLTDFGTSDGYVAAMKGVVASISPAVLVDDVSHDIPPGDVAAGAWALRAYWRRYPEGTVHLAVVDPGVGSARRGLAAEIGGRLFVAPDNGLLTYALQAGDVATVVSIERPDARLERVSATFHGRDIFAPAAAHLARGAPVLDLGPRVDDPVLLAVAPPVRSANRALGSVIHVDRFGNLVTNIPADWLAPAASIVVAGREVGRVRTTYADAAPGEPVALVGSADLLEVAVRDGSAATVLEAGRGSEVRAEYVPES